MESMEYALGWSKYNMWILGVWPEPIDTSRTKRYLSKVIFWITMAITFLFICMPINAHLFYVTRSMNEVIQNMAVNVPTFFAFIKQGLLRYRGEALATLLRQIVEDWLRPKTNAERETMLNNAKKSHNISIMSSSLTYFFIMTFMMMGIWNGFIMQDESKIVFEGMPLPSFFPYDLKKSPNFELTWSGMVLGVIVTAVCYSGFDTFLALLTLHLCGQLAVLKLNLKGLVGASRHDDFAHFREKLGSLVYRHEELYRYSLIVEDYFNLALLVQTVISTVMFCLTVYRSIAILNREESIAEVLYTVVHVMYTMVHFFFYCYIGDHLLLESTSVAQSVFDSEWYDLPPKHAISLTIIMMRANTSFKLTAGKFSVFSLEMFSTIIKTSAGYLSVLLARNDKGVEE